MTAINAFDNIGLGIPATNGAERKELGQEDFMTLMIAQFRNQDPMKPMENGDFLGQLAQFGTVSGIDELNSAFSGLQGSLQSNQALQAANLVGRDVLADADSGWLAPDGQIEGAVELSSSAANVQIDITDSSGQLLRTIDLGLQEAGMPRFTWDGRDASGELMPSGQYTVSARVLRGTQVESLPTLVNSNIESVTLGRNGQGLTLNLAGGTQLSLSQVRQII